MEIGRMKERSIVTIADTPKSILRNAYGSENMDERSLNRIAPSSGLNRHRVGVSPVRVKRSINDSVPTAVVTPSPPIHISTRTTSDQPQAFLAKANSAVSHRYSFHGLQSGFDPSQGELVGTSSSVGTFFAASTALARRSRSSIGSSNLGLVPRKLVYDDFDDAKPATQDHGYQRGHWLGGHMDVESQVPSNSILTLHSLVDDPHRSLPAPRDDSQERRMKVLEARLRELEALVADRRSNDPIATEVHKVTMSEYRASKEAMRRTSTPNSGSKGNSAGTLSVAVSPMMAFDSGIFRVQPTFQSEVKVQKEVERLEKKLKHQEEMAEALRAQHFKQIEQLTRQLAANEDMTQTLRSRIRELELESDLWQNRFRLYSDVDMAKILRENERLRARLRKRSSRGEDEEKMELARKEEQLEKECDKLRARCVELEQKYQAVKAKYKDAIKAYRTRRRQDHMEVESLKAMLELRNAKVVGLERMLDQVGMTSEPPPPSVGTSVTIPETNSLSELGKFNLEKCNGITDCLSKICTRLKRNEPLDPADVLDYGPTSMGIKIHGQNSTQFGNKPSEQAIEELANKMSTLHSIVVDLYGDDLANSVSCSVQ